MGALQRRTLAVAFALLLLVPPAVVSAAGVEALFDLSSPSGGPFPSDRFSVDDHHHLTGIRVNLPKPDCAARPSDCADIDVINTLDGFNLQPRLAIPFSGPIDPATVTSETVFLVNLGDTRGGGAKGERVGINQVVWDPATNTLFAESDAFLDQHTRYALVVTDGVRDAAGDPVEAGAFARFRHGWHWGHPKDHELEEYRGGVLHALELLHSHPRHDQHRRHHEVVAASVFTTQSVTAVLEKIRHQIKRTNPAPATMLGTFPLTDIVSIVVTRQTGTAPTFSTSFFPTPALSIFPGSVGSLAFGTFASPDYETAEKFIPAVGTRTGTPVAQSVSNIAFNLTLPAGTPPAGGWPVVIFGHGFTDSKQGAPVVVASALASHGLATIAINVVGHGGGPLGTLTVNRVSGPAVSIPAGGRGIDQDGNGTIDSTEGVNAAVPRGLIGSRDGLRQTVVDLMQLVRVIETGGLPGLDRSRIYYAGQSFGGIYGTIFLAVESSIRAGVPNVPGGPIIEIARLSPSFRALVGVALATRVPALLNAGPLAPPQWGFNENVPLRDQPALVNGVAGAVPIQEVLENTEWVSQSGNPVAYARYIRQSPLDGMEPKSVIVQFARGDQTVPNPTASALIRAGDLADRTLYYRNDLAFAANAATPKNPHTFLTNVAVPSVAAFALGAQQQIAIFLASDGATVVDPDAAGPIFEVPITGALPEVLNFIP